MPIFRYFLVMGPVLLGLLFLADAQLPPPGAISNSTNFYGLPVTPSTRSAATHLTVVWAPAPDMNSPAVLAAAPPPDPAATAAIAQATPSKVASTSTARPDTPPKKVKKVARKRNWRNDFALANPPYGRDYDRTRIW